MPSYKSELCKACDKPFVDGDDVVVCPECGTPHHRECYIKNGSCINDDLHSQGYVWSKSVPEKDSTERANSSEIICRVCGTKNSASSLSCISCRSPLEFSKSNKAFQIDTSKINLLDTATKSATYRNNYRRLDMNGATLEGESDISEAEIHYFVGIGSKDFLARFNRMKQKNSLTFNLYAFFLGFAYFFYRKMYKIGAILLLIWILMYTPVIFAVKDTVESLKSASIPVTLDNIMENIKNVVGTTHIANASIFVGLSFLELLFCGFFFNKLYMKHTVNSIRKIRKRCQESGQNFRVAAKDLYISELEFYGGVSIASFILSQMCMSFGLELYMSLWLR